MDYPKARSSNFKSSGISDFDEMAIINKCFGSGQGPVAFKPIFFCLGVSMVTVFTLTQ